MKNVQGKGKFHAIECDVTKESSVIETFESIKKKFGSLHVLVNNAGRTTLGGLTGMTIFFYLWKHKFKWTCIQMKLVKTFD